MDQQTPPSARKPADIFLDISSNHFPQRQLHVIVYSRNCLFDNHRYILNTFRIILHPPVHLTDKL
jgi:hypothetical protein